MGRRRLRLPVAEDEEEEEEDEGQRLRTVITTRPSAAPSPIVTSAAAAPDAPLEISDDDEDFADVPDAFSSPSPPPPPDPSLEDGGQPRDMGSSARARVRVDAEGEGPSNPVDAVLRALGLRLKRDWLTSCLAWLSRSYVGFEGLDDASKAKLCFEQFLLSDMNFSGDGGLPENVSTMHKVTLDGPYVLQVDEIANVSAPLRDRYHEAVAGSKRCLKLLMTDGKQRVIGMEYRPISQLKVLAHAGLKVAVQNVHVQRGLLMLLPEVIVVLGGLIEELEAARERLVHEVNKPPRGRRNQPVFPLSERASLAAWPSTVAENIERSISSIPHDGNLLQTAHHGNFTTSHISRLGPIEGVVVPSNEGSILEQSVSVHTRRTSEQFSAARADMEELTVSHIQSTIGEVSVQLGQHTGRDQTHTSTFQGTEGSVPALSAIQQSEDCCVEEISIAPICLDSGLSPSSNTGVGEGDIDMDDVNIVEHPLILNGEREMPFTYLASLLAKWAAKEDSLPSIQGKIKCFLTGVKSFHFKQRSTYELLVYVDDGSLISEVLVDHCVVEKGIGYSPKEVTAALSSADKTTSSTIREAMKKFQLFLTKFEGTMVVEINKERTVPVAVEMNQNFTTSDSWLLLKRLNKFTVSMSAQQQCSKVIDVSP